MSKGPLCPGCHAWPSAVKHKQLTTGIHAKLLRMNLTGLTPLLDSYG
jgi:hypothetical protein